MVIAPFGLAGSLYQFSVPNNSAEVVAKAWACGDIAGSLEAGRKHRSLKTVHETLVQGEAVHYVWRLEDGNRGDVAAHLQCLSDVARSIVALGWGLDLAIGHGVLLSEEDVAGLEGERWLPGADGAESGLRVPVAGTLDDVLAHHEHFLKRVNASCFVPPPPLSRFRVIEYRRAIEAPDRPFAAFSLLKPDASGFRSFDAARRGLTVAGMMRGAVKSSAIQSGWPPEKIAAFVLGHGSGERAVAERGRFAYVPIPTIERRDTGSGVAGSVRRVLAMACGDGCQDEIAWARRALSGQELVDEKTGHTIAMLSVVPSTDGVIRRYTQAASCWATVTPVVLPGYDDPRHYRRRLEAGVNAQEQRTLLDQLETRVDGLLRKAIVQAGYSEVLAQHAELEWRKIGFWPGSDTADRYGVPDHLKRYPRYHVRVRWRDSRGREVKLAGPICFGGGRYYGLGLFAAV
jgi:CRISPR-associated protein Csb2